ncbi:MAG TPA: AAA domain-containing protein [Candidatus Binataceae bacterium]|nr:AAA domain-containing protein [Candidatus Binataceae bacterium]
MTGHLFGGEVTSSPSPGRRAAVDAARSKWIEELTDLSRRNNLLYFRELKIGTLALDVRDRDSNKWESFLAGEPVPLSALLPRGDAKLISAKAREIQRRALSNLDERALDTLFLAIGFATWPANDGGSPTEAPVVLAPAILKRQGREGSQTTIALPGEPQMNPVLLQKLESDFGLRLSGEDLLPSNQSSDRQAQLSPRDTLKRLRLAASNIDGFRVTYDAAVGNFAFYKMAMVEDLKSEPAWLYESDLVAAIAGDLTARQTLSSGRAGIDPRELDCVQPENEFLVLDADSSQQSTIAAALSPQSGVIVGPPGTGKTQTIANLIAELAARGKRVLFVAEKKAALDQVRDRLTKVGLGNLALDLHGANLKRKDILKQIGVTLDEIRTIPPVQADDLHGRFIVRRNKLREHVTQLHAKQPPSAKSFFDLQGLLLSTNPEQTSSTRWRGQPLERLTPNSIAAAGDLIQELGSFAGLFFGSDPSPWRNANLTDGDAVAGAVEAADHLAQDGLPKLKMSIADFVAEVRAASPMNLNELNNLLEVQRRINEVVGEFDCAIFATDLDQLQLSMGPAAGFFGRLLSWCFSSKYRSAARRLRSLSRDPQTSAKILLERTRVASKLKCDWTNFADRDVLPVASKSLDRCSIALGQAVQNLQLLASSLRRSGLMSLSLGDLESLVALLAADHITPFGLPRYHEIGRRLSELGVADFLRELRSSAAPPERWRELLYSAWYASCLASLRAKIPQLGGFNGRVHDDVVEQFKHLDEERMQLSVERVRRAYAESAVATMNEHPDQEDLVRREANRQRGGLSFRNLASKASDVLLALRPCWLASPLSVSELLPRKSGMFDVVLFDEASQILPADAQPALARAIHAIVAGDPNQLPPTTFFVGGADGAVGVDDDNATAGFQSLLNLMLALLSPWTLSWHYRSRDEALIAFSNRHIYGGRLVTFPGVGAEGSTISHVLVPFFADRDGQEESSSDEVRKVVELILQHASTRPDESLGVITMGITHANRIQASLDDALRGRPELEEFFDEHKDDRFFVKNLERVQGDERDSIILSIGYGKDRSGNLPYRFGPLLTEGGERRLNVAITRAKRRMTVVSSFDHHDMEPGRSKARGIELLRLYLEYAASGGKILGDRGLTNVPLDPFEADVCDALTARGAHLLPQFGASGYRIDLVAEHPKKPGRLVLAIECDGASYHSVPTTRDRDRLRQQHLEALGWRFHRIWSTDWFLRRQQEIERALKAIAAAVAYADMVDGGGAPPSSGSDDAIPKSTGLAARSEFSRQRSRPQVFSGKNIGNYTDRELVRLVQWIWSDGRLRTDEETLEEMVKELGFQRRCPRIVATIRGAITHARRSQNGQPPVLFQ